MSDISDAIGGDFDTSSVEPATGFEPMPPAWYPVQIDGAEVRDTKAGTGKLLALELTVVGENMAGRKLWPRLNIVNPNQQAVEIAMRELAAIGQACGLAAITDTSELLGQILEVKVKIKKETDREPDNEVCGYRAAAASSGAAEPPVQKAPATTKPAAATKTAKAPAAAAAAPAAKSKRPWER